MSAEIIDGTKVAKGVLKALTLDVTELTPKLGRPPGLAVVLCGDNPASQVYVASKSKKAKSCGIAVTDVVLPSTATDAELQGVLAELSARTDIDGILLQLPLPAGLDEFGALQAIAPEKDADGLHPYNQGLLLRAAPAPEPCTPKGCMLLIKEGLRILGRAPSLSGLSAVVVGRSVLVGKPLGMLLLNEHCTVTYAHSRTKDLASVCRSADILVAAVGKPKLFGPEFVKPGAIVIDVGINRDHDGIVGDVDYAAVLGVAGAITPVPGGVGPMTIAMLLQNTVQAARMRL